MIVICDISHVTLSHIVFLDVSYQVDEHIRNSFFLGGHFITWPPFKFPCPKEFFYCLQFSSHFLFLCLLYSLFDHPYSIFAVNLPESSLENSFLLFSSFCCLTSSASFLYSLSNSSTSFFVFFRFSLLSQVSSSAVYLFYCTKNFFFPLTILLFSIFSTSNFSSPLIITSFGRVFLCSSIWGLYNHTRLTLTMECILIKLDSCYKTTKKKTISHAFINLIENIQEYNVGKI